MSSDLECFVVMPFGRKPLPDGSGRQYDFDKVYRVIIQRAAREAGMQPVRADERVSSALIHTDMFRDLRDRRVVIADLSLDNPNVFYELGVRHVMNAGGTVLVCREGSPLPFDIKLSRVIFYRFDGESLDWEEVERVVKSLKVALTDAAGGRPDSPVHALLESVLPAPQVSATGAPAVPCAEDAAGAEPAAPYQQLVADAWCRDAVAPHTLFAAHLGAVFGARALACLCLRTDPTSAAARQVANSLNDLQQYRLANTLYGRLYTAQALPRGSLLAYASSYSEAHPDRDGAVQAIAYAEEALATVERDFPGQVDQKEAVAALAECHRRLAGLYQWRWFCSVNQAGLDQAVRRADLEQAIHQFDQAIRSTDLGRRLGSIHHPGYLAQALLKQLVLLRIRDGDTERADVERHRDAILAITPREGDDRKGLSYLGWYQALTLADMGAAEASQRKAIETGLSDAALKSDPDCLEIGRRQYVLLRRFIDQYLPYLRNHSLVGAIAQVLQAGLAARD